MQSLVLNESEGPPRWWALALLLADVRSRPYDDQAHANPFGWFAREDCGLISYIEEAGRFVRTVLDSRGTSKLYMGHLDRTERRQYWALCFSRVRAAIRGLRPSVLPAA